VVSDNRSAAEILTRSVLGGKTASIAWLDAVPEIAMTRERREGFLAAANEAGIAPLVESGLHYDRASGAAMMRRILTDHGLPDALVTASFTLLQGVLDVLLDQPDPLPKALKIATFGDDRLLDFLPLAVNSLPQDHEAIANATLEQALSAIAQEGPVDTIVINRSLKTRAADRQSRPVQTTSAEKTC
jgi:LacI family fructose operon transcriptional repressor